MYDSGVVSGGPAGEGRSFSGYSDAVYFSRALGLNSASWRHVKRGVGRRWSVYGILDGVSVFLLGFSGDSNGGESER